MRSEDALLTLAEIAATFVGFAALVSVLARRSRGELHRVTILRLRVVVVASLVVVISALLPVVMSNYGLPPETVWQASGIAAFVVNLVAVISSARWISRAQFRLFAPFIGIWVVEVVAEVSVILVALGVLRHLAPGLFLTFLGAALVQAVLAFIALLDTLLHEELA